MKTQHKKPFGRHWKQSYRGNSQLEEHTLKKSERLQIKDSKV